MCGCRFTQRPGSAFSGRVFADDIIVLAVRWYVRNPLSYAEIGEWLAERGILVDQSTITTGSNRFCHSSARQPTGTASRSASTGASTRRMPGSAAAGTTSMEPSMGVARAWTP